MIGQTLVCQICNQPMNISEARTDDRGKAVHGECYAKALAKPDSFQSEETRKSSTAA